ncbi:MAG: GAF domain-containing protein [Desulfamplus sp.]|nr:GAF domain-containing protein [Desulfamplus sp.]
MRQNKKTENPDIRNTNKTIDVMIEIADAVNRTDSLDEFYEAIHKSLSRIINVDNFFIAIYDENKDCISFPYYFDQKDIYDIKPLYNISKTASLTAQVINEKKPMIFYKEDTLRIAESKGLPPLGSVSQVWLGAPLKTKKGVIGVIAVQSYAYRDMYQKSDLNILNIVSQYIALAVERKKSDEAYKNQRKILEKILQTSPVGIALLENRIFKWVNPEMLTLFGYDKKEDFEGNTTDMLYESNESFIENGKTIYSTIYEGKRTEIEINLKKKDGSIFPASIHISAAAPENPMAWIIATFTDLSTRKIADAEKIKNEKLQGVLEMAGAVCHELNQPLQALVGYSELIMMDQRPDSQISKDMAAIKKNIERIARITQRLATITSYKTVDYPGNKKIVDIWGSSDS